MNRPRLKKMLKFLRELDESKFKYAAFVSEHNDVCGTVCCALGWTPTIFKKSPWKWVPNPKYGKLILTYDNESSFIEYNAKDFFETNISEIHFMFYGYSTVNEYIAKKTRYGRSCDVTLEQVCNRIDLVLNWDKAMKDPEAWGLI